MCSRFSFRVPPPPDRLPNVTHNVTATENNAHQRRIGNMQWTQVTPTRSHSVSPDQSSPAQSPVQSSPVQSSPVQSSFQALSSPAQPSPAQPSRARARFGTFALSHSVSLTHLPTQSLILSATIFCHQVTRLLSQAQSARQRKRRASQCLCGVAKAQTSS